MLKIINDLNKSIHFYEYCAPQISKIIRKVKKR